MALDRLTPSSTTPGAVDGDDYMDQVLEELTGLWNRATITLTAVSGTNTITATAAPALTGALDGNMNFILKPAATNSGAVTLNVNGSGAVAVVDAEGTALTAGAIRINANYLLHYDSGIAKYVVVGYTPAAVVAVGSKLISRVQLTAARGSIDFVHGAVPTDGVGSVVLDSTYDTYELVISGCQPATDDVEAWLRIGTGGGPTYQTAGYSSYVRAQASATEATAINTNLGQMNMTRSSGTLDVGNASGEDFDATIKFADPSGATNFFRMYGQCVYGAAVGGASMFASTLFSGGYNTAVAITAIRFQFESGNINTGGVACLYGKTKS